MALSIAELIILSLIVDWLFRKCQIPGLVGMLLVGIALGPHVFGLLNPALMSVSSDLRMIALIVILLRAGFELSKQTLRKVGSYAILLSFVPAVMEGIAITFLGHYLLGLSYMESAILGSVLSAVSPAVVVPLMLRFIEQRKGTQKGIPTLVLAASSIDDVFVIVIYSVLIGMYTGEQVNVVWKLVGIPLSVIFGILVGILCGFVLYLIFEKFNPRATKRLLVILGVSIVLVNIERGIEHFIPFAALLAVMTIGFIILEKSQYMAREISSRLGKLWIFAEIILFTLVGAQVNLKVAFNAGVMGSLLVFLGLIARSLGTYLCLLKSHLSASERFFVVIAYLPKATVQAAIGGAPLLAMKLAGMNTQPGEVILAIAVLSILLTAPLGAWAISLVGNRVLKIAPIDSSQEAGQTEASHEEIADYYRVRDLMAADVSALKENSNLKAIFDYFAEYDFLICPIVNAENQLTGFVTLEDLRAVLTQPNAWDIALAQDVVHPQAEKIFPQTSLSEGIRVAGYLGVDQIPVVEHDSKKVVGIFDARKARKFLEEKFIGLRNKQ